MQGGHRVVLVQKNQAVALLDRQCGQQLLLLIAGFAADDKFLCMEKAGHRNHSHSRGKTDGEQAKPQLSVPPPAQHVFLLYARGFHAPFFLLHAHPSLTCLPP